MPDFDAWLKGQKTEPKTPAPKPTGGAFDSWLSGAATDRPAPRAYIPPAERQEFGRRMPSLDQPQSRFRFSTPAEPQEVITPDSTTGPLAESLRQQERRAFEKKGTFAQWYERGYDALARGGGQLSKMARQTTEAGMGVARGLNSGDFTPVPIESWRRFEAQRNAELEAQRQGRPSSFATDVAEGIIEAAPQAAGAYLLTAATGGGLPAMMAVGGGMSAAGADWRDPKRAAAQTAIGAVAPVVGGKIGQKVGGAIASRLARPGAQAVARAAGEIGGGGAGNIAATSAEQLAFEGRIDPRSVAVSGLVGGALSTPGAIGAARGPAIRARVPFRDARPTQEFPAIQGPTRPTDRLVSRVTSPEDAPTAGLPGESLPLLNQVNNPEGGVPPRSEPLSGRFGQLVRAQEAQRAAAPQARRIDTGELSPISYLKRATKGEGVRVSDRGEAALLGSKEAGIVGLTNKGSRYRLSDAQVMLDEGGFILDDGRRFTDPSVTENDVLDFLGASGKQGRLNTRGLEQRLADEEAEYYARLEADQGIEPMLSESGALEDIGSFFDDMRAQETPGLQRSARLPIREFNDSGPLPEIYEAPPKPFEVKLAKERDRAAEIRGPRLEEIGYFTPQQPQARKAAPPSQDPDAALGKLWDRPPETQALFKGAPPSQNPDSVLGRLFRRRPEPNPLFKGAPNRSQRTPPLEVVSALRKAGLLTGVKTHLRNVGGNIAFAGAEEVSRLPASLMDLAISTVNKRRTITGPSPSAVARSAYSAATEGVREAGQIMRRGLTDKQAQALQLGQEINSGNRILDGYVNGVFRTLGAEDAVFRQNAFKRAIFDRSLAQAKTEANQGKIGRADIRSRARQLAANPDPALTANAILDSEVAVFANENIVNTFLNAGREKISGLPGGKAANFAVDMVLPFTKTPTNIVARMLEYSPAGFGKNAVQVAKAITNRSFTAAEQRAFSQTFGRATTGSALILLGAKLGAAGLLTGFAETDPSKRNRDVAAGRTPGAILNPYTGTWHQVAAFTPIGSLLTLGATLQREDSRELQDEGKRGERLAAAGMQAVAQQPLLIGAKEVSEAITRPGTTGERAGRIAGSFVPTIVSDVGELADSTRREGKGFIGQVQRRVPFARNYLPAAEDATGRPLEDRKTSFFDPTLTSTARDKSDPLMRELTRLDLGLSKPQRNPGESEAAHRERSTKFGREFGSLTDSIVRTTDYWRLTDEERRTAFDVARRYLQARERGEVEEKTSADIIEAARALVERRKEKAKEKK